MDVFESKGVSGDLRVEREGKEVRAQKPIPQKYGRPALNQEQLNLSQQHSKAQTCPRWRQTSRRRKLPGQATVNATARVLSLPTLLDYLK
jgi:hypothetical protein